jgi:hypothetical protein
MKLIRRPRMYFLKDVLYIYLMCHFLVHDWLKKLFLIFTNSTSPCKTLYQSYTTINIVQLKYFRRTIYYDTVR